MKIAVLGAGAFGSALAMSFARGGHDVWLWSRRPAQVRAMAEARENADRLPGVAFPDGLTPTAEIPRDAEVVLLAVPMQQQAALLEAHGDVLAQKPLVSCCKGLSLETGEGPTAVLPMVPAPAVLTGPSFAADIARGLPTALTLACGDAAHGAWLQERLSAPNLRLYRTTDVVGAEIGGALKNVVAIGCGAVMGAGLGVSARAALMTRGFAEIVRFATSRGARAETLGGLSGLGDLTLTCTSDLSRNYRLGVALGQGKAFDANVTVEGAATARALSARATRDGLDLPLTQAIAALLEGDLDVGQAMDALLARPAGTET